MSIATNLFAPLSEQTKKDVLVEFRAGLMEKKANSKMVHPDKRKGLVQLKLSSADNIVQFIWKDRTTGSTVIDLMLFPEDATFRKVHEAKGRVYVLEFKTSDKKLFFWMQEPKDDKDTQHCENINKYINNPPQPGQSGLSGLGGLNNALSGLGGLGGFGALGGSGLDIGGLDQNHLLQLLRNQASLRGVQGSRATASESTPSQRPTPAPSSTTQTPSAAAPAPSSASSTAPSSSSAAPVNAQTLQNLLAGIAQQMHQPKGPSLTDIVDADNLISSGLFDNPAVVAKLAEFLPEGPVTAENLKENVRSPQFQQAVSMFNQALRSGQLSSIMQSFGLDITAIGPNSTIEDFLLAIQKKAKEDDKKDKMDTSQ